MITFNINSGKISISDCLISRVQNRIIVMKMEKYPSRCDSGLCHVSRDFTIQIDGACKNDDLFYYSNGSTMLAIDRNIYEMLPFEDFILKEGRNIFVEEIFNQIEREIPF